MNMKTQTRILLEHRIARKTVRTLLAAGYTLGVDNGGDIPEVDFSKSEKEVLSYMFATDDEDLIVHKDDLLVGWIHFVYGNDGYDVISDYTVNLDSVLAPIHEYTDKLEAQYA